MSKRKSWYKDAKEQLFPAEVLEELKKYPIYSQEDTPLSKQYVSMRIFSTCSNHVFFITEWDGEDLLFGWAKVDGLGWWEGGYFSMEEICTTPMFLNGREVNSYAFNRDVVFEPMTMNEATIREARIYNDCDIIGLPPKPDNESSTTNLDNQSVQKEASIDSL